MAGRPRGGITHPDETGGPAGETSGPARRSRGGPDGPGRLGRSVPRPPGTRPRGTPAPLGSADDLPFGPPTGGIRRPVDRRRHLTRMGLVATAMGVAVGLMALPFLSAAGLFAKASADHFLELPSDLVTPPLPQRSTILAADGSVIATLTGAEDRQVVQGDQIPKIMREAIVAIEDARFYSHNGVDPQGVLRAAARNSEAGSTTQGGSTLTQQYVKNVLLQDASTPEERDAVAGDSLDRKLRELRYAVAIEQRFSKDEILTRYLNIAYFGDGAYGVGTAAEHYFGVPISEVTLEQAALLAGLVQSPSRYDPVNHPQAALERRNMVLTRMADENYVSRTQADAARQMPIDVLTDQPTTQDSCETSSAPFFCDYIRTQLSANPALGATKEERDRRIHEGGLVIKTTLNPQVQQAAQMAVNSTVPPDNRVSATEVVIQPGTGAILGMAVNRVYGTDEAANQTKVPLPTKDTFQPGSTFKTFTVAAALEQGYGVNTAWYSPACYSTDAFPLDRGEGDCPKGYQNSDPAEAGIYRMDDATWDSVNTYFIQLEEKVGVPAVVEMATRLGVSADHLKDIPATKGDVTIGGEYVSPMDMALAYSTLAAGGVRCEPRFATSVVDSGGQQIDVGNTPKCERVLAQGVADTTTSILAGVLTRGTGGNARFDHPAAGKTGTNDGFSSAWFVGYTPQIAAAVAVGDPNGAVAHPLRNVVVNGRTWPHVFGGDLPAMIWGASMRGALAGQPVQALPAADPAVARGTKGGRLMNTPPPAPTPTLPNLGDLLPGAGTGPTPGLPGVGQGGGQGQGQVIVPQTNQGQQQQGRPGRNDQGR
ncbi:penicillin-binding protein [Frankia sp. Mgl5]|uniref:transglycosylase domain-containing protein n=1 Tax=Frankia sp. Mgl5 TaxID=2933793 RepID=UPI00200D6ECB|nr:transglycosylase domain-containing protein [Frankia sp. Mgl5]MCK9930370.1 penicillin-binding protein [Frankia sp. Mgl5]